jgi:uncharacterized protein (DUF1501 family)
MTSFDVDPTAPEPIVRRDFLRSLAAAGTAAWIAGEPRALAASDQPAPASTADACILIWMAGGMAAPETFDPKHYEPFRKGLETKRMLSTFPAINTSVDGLQICRGMENIAEVMDRATLIRSHVLPDLGSILHSRHQYHWHTGYVPPQTVACPHIGAWMAKVLGPRNPVIPAFVNIGQRPDIVAEKEELKAYTTAGFFGNEYGPFNLPDPKEAMQAVRPPKGMDVGRFQSRDRLFRSLLNRNPQREFMSSYQQESMLRSMDNAYRLLSSRHRDAFDISLEPQESRDAYDTGRFGQGLLLARRLVESGARFVEVASEFVGFKRWDAHANGHQLVAGMHAEIDRPIARLIRDLELRGLLDRTLVVIATEFSRDAIIEGAPGSDAIDQAFIKTDVVSEMQHYGLHRHYTGSSSTVMFGGGMKRGFVYGETAPERPLLAIRNPVTVTDLHATIMAAMGIRPDTGFTVEGRPFYVTEDGKGQPVRELFAAG